MKDLNGLILIGGESLRMGEDKSTIQYHDKPQAQHLFDLLSAINITPFLSLRKGQIPTFPSKHVKDEFDVKGPLNGLLSAHKLYPMNAWLVLAVDMPLISKSTLLTLIAERDTKSCATSLIGNKNEFPQPLAAIWEPHGLSLLMTHHKKGSTIYPTAFLMNNKVKCVKADNIELLNVNEKKDAIQVLQKIKNR